jgi:PKD repeat protein
VVLTPYTGFGCPDTLSTTITVTDVVANYNISPAPKQCFKGNAFTFTNASSTNSSPLTYDWSFGDGNTSTATSPSKSYALADSFKVRLIATTPEGCKDTISKYVTVYPSPQMGFSINDSDQCFKNHNFIFTNTTSLASGSKTNYWTFGDGTSSSQNDPSKIYSSYGNYTVKLKVISDKGCSDSISKQVLVYAMPKAKFSVNDSDQCFKNHNFVFTNNSSIPVGSNTYQWQFGDSTVSLSVSPSKQYAYSNAFNIKLIAFSDHNCTYTTSKIVYVYSMPKANFLRSDTGKCLKGYYKKNDRGVSMTYNLCTQ